MVRYCSRLTLRYVQIITVQGIVKDMQKTKTCLGGCHCGKVRYQVQIARFEAIICNCSICSKKGFIHLIVSESQFTLLQGQDELSTYTFNTGTGV
jgi:hypothetical protein